MDLNNYLKAGYPRFLHRNPRTFEGHRYPQNRELAILFLGLPARHNRTRNRPSHG